MTVEERALLVEFAVKTSNGRRPVCAGTASESFEATASLIDHFDKAGADSILVVTPYYAVPPQRGAIMAPQPLGRVFNASGKTVHGVRVEMKTNR